MNQDTKKRERLQSKGSQDPDLRKGAETEREDSSNRAGTGAREHIKPASRQEVSPNTPSGQET